MTNRIPRKIALNIGKGLCRLTIEESMDYLFHEVLAKDRGPIVSVGNSSGLRFSCFLSSELQYQLHARIRTYPGGNHSRGHEQGCVSARRCLAEGPCNERQN